MEAQKIELSVGWERPHLVSAVSMSAGRWGVRKGASARGGHVSSSTKYGTVSQRLNTRSTLNQHSKPPVTYTTLPVEFAEEGSVKVENLSGEGAHNNVLARVPPSILRYTTPREVGVARCITSALLHLRGEPRRALTNQRNEFDRLPYQ